MRIGAALGADVPFFLYGGTALGSGRGDELYPVDDARGWASSSSSRRLAWRLPMRIAGSTKTARPAIAFARAPARSTSAGRRGPSAWRTIFRPLSPGATRRSPRWWRPVPGRGAGRGHDRQRIGGFRLFTEAQHLAPPGGLSVRTGSFW